MYIDPSNQRVFHHRYLNHPISDTKIHKPDDVFNIFDGNLYETLQQIAMKIRSQWFDILFINFQNIQKHTNKKRKFFIRIK